MRKLLAFVAGMTIVLSVSGCTPRVRVIANPKAHQSGIRYYRPKPYLLVTSGAASVTVDSGAKTTTNTTVPDPKTVNIQLQYLPDFEEEYALDVRSGFGTADVSIALDDGWNLTSINQNLDSKTAENIEAVGSLLEGIASVSAPNAAKGESGRQPSAPVFSVCATNIPLGYYESVISKDSCGRKRLYGFRYVGFMPYATCPQVMGGVECGQCQTSDLYGLVFEDDCMVFRRLDDVRMLDRASQITEVASGEAQNNSVRVSRQVEVKKTPDSKELRTTATFTMKDEVQVEPINGSVYHFEVPQLVPSAGQ